MNSRIRKSGNSPSKYILPVILILSLSAALFVRFNRDENAPPEYVETGRKVTCLGTFGTFIVIADSADSERILNSVDSLVRHLEVETGRFAHGELSQINEMGIAVLSECSEDISFLLEQSLYISSITDSLFDPAIGALSELWGFPLDPHLPDSSEIDLILHISGVANLEIVGDTIKLKSAAKLDLGAIAKGYAVDRAYSLAMELGAQGTLIEIGGEIRCGSTDRVQREWIIALRDPESSGILRTYSMNEGAVATSGTYESSFEINGRRYSHIMNPFTGYPEEEVLSVTVFADDAYIADALATAIAVGDAPLAETVPDSLYSRIIIIDEKGGVNEIEGGQ